jgi:tetratricopeptide (TPR) repeat protein
VGEVIDIWTGRRACALQSAIRMSNDAFARRLGVSLRTVASWHDAPDLQPRPETQAILDTVLDTASAGVLARFRIFLAETPQVAIPAPSPSPEGLSLVIPGVRTDDITRRLLLSQSAAPDHAPPNFTLLAVTEAIRREMEDTLVSGTVSAARLERIEETVAAHIRAYTSTPPLSALAGILTDFADVRRLCAERQPATIQGRLSEMAALLATLAADSLMKLGQITEAHAWYGTARLAADDTGNRELRARVRAQEAMLPYYYGDLAEAIRLSRDAQGILDGTPRAAGALAVAAEARALSRQPGCRADAERAMALAQDLVTGAAEPDNDEAFHFGERRLLFYLSSTLTNLGESSRAARVQDQALNIYGDTPILIDPVLIRLDQVQLLATEGDLNGTRSLAEQTCLGLTAEHRTPIVAARLRQILKAVPELDGTYQVLSELRQMVINPNRLGPTS